jgi:serine/threonine protein kinase
MSFLVLRVVADDYELKTEQLRSFLDQGLSALRSLHEMGIAHRDLKPQNMFWSNDNKLFVSRGTLEQHVHTVSYSMSLAQWRACGHLCPGVSLS